jgi:hypothetical protein
MKTGPEIGWLIMEIPFQNWTNLSGIRTFENGTISLKDTNRPFEYQTNPVFGQSLY